MVVNMDRTVQIFSDFTLVWAAMNLSNALPVQIGVADVAAQKGMIVTVDDDARIHMRYLISYPSCKKLHFPSSSQVLIRQLTMMLHCFLQVILAQNPL